MTKATTRQPRLVIYGYGHVGRQVAARFQDAAEVIISDPALPTQPSAAELRSCDLGIICVGTPPQPDGSCDTSAVETVVAQAGPQLLWIRSTVPPGTCDTLAQRYNKRICHSPEYIGETEYSAAYDLEDFLIIGGRGPDRRAVINLVLQQKRPPTRIHQCSTVESELIKYMENAFLALKVAFVNEFHDLAAAFGADWHKVREGWLLDPRIGTSHTIVFPHARGFAGRCLPKDLDALQAATTRTGTPTPLLNGVIEANRRLRNHLDDLVDVPADLHHTSLPASR